MHSHHIHNHHIPTHSQQCTIKQQWSQDPSSPRSNLKVLKIKSPNCCKRKIICPLLHSILPHVISVNWTKSVFYAYTGREQSIWVCLSILYQSCSWSYSRNCCWPQNSLLIHPPAFHPSLFLLSLSPGSLRSSTELVNLHFSAWMAETSHTLKLMSKWKHQHCWFYSSQRCY